MFDGGAPALKARTLAARRKIRSEGSDTTVRKTAQRILASQLRKHKVPFVVARVDEEHELECPSIPTPALSTLDTIAPEDPCVIQHSTKVGSQ